MDWQNKLTNCFLCGRKHEIMQTPGIVDFVHCPYDPDGGYLPGMEGIKPRMSHNKYGVLVYVNPKETMKGIPEDRI